MQNYQMEKNKETIDEKAKRLAMKDANSVQIDTTAEGRSYLRSRFEYWKKKLSV